MYILYKINRKQYEVPTIFYLQYKLKCIYTYKYEYNIQYYLRFYYDALKHIKI